MRTCSLPNHHSTVQPPIQPPSNRYISQRVLFVNIDAAMASQLLTIKVLEALKVRNGSVTFVSTQRLQAQAATHPCASQASQPDTPNYPNAHTQTRNITPKTGRVWGPVHAPQRGHQWHAHPRLPGWLPAVRSLLAERAGVRAAEL